jgi:hypothetical protein
MTQGMQIDLEAGEDMETDHLLESPKKHNLANILILA